ncbi:MAG TPA: hypothetical protein VGW34_01125 [Allosphingosinicella sp.]|nr:hypothetical protein [Allosphingosinicella sp.]
MAEFVYHVDDSGAYVQLDAQNGETLNPEMVQAWTSMRILRALDEISTRLLGLKEELARVAQGVN